MLAIIIIYYVTGPPQKGCPNAFSISLSQNKAISTDDEAIHEVKKYVINSGMRNRDYLLEKLRNPKFVIKEIELSSWPLRYVEAWTFENSVAIDQNGTIFEKMICP
ncbi:MAG: hypothetical protein AABX01_02035 [Candidatus Micrarchaeota archaeon]